MKKFIFLLAIMAMLFTMNAFAQTTPSAVITGNAVGIIGPGGTLYPVSLSAQLVGCGPEVPLVPGGSIVTNFYKVAAPPPTYDASITVYGNDIITCGTQNYTTYAVTWLINNQPAAPTATYRVIQGASCNISNGTCKPIGFVPPVITKATGLFCPVGQILNGFNADYTPACQAFTGSLIPPFRTNGVLNSDQTQLNLTGINGIQLSASGSTVSVDGSALTRLAPNASQTITQPTNTDLNVQTSGTGEFQYNGDQIATINQIPSVAGFIQSNPAGNQTINQPGATTLTVNRATFTDALFNNSPFRCVETYLSADIAHSGTDYGAAISAAVQASDLLNPTTLKICSPGEHPIFTQALFDRPIKFVMTGSKLIPQAGSYFTNAVIPKTGSTANSSSSSIIVSSTTSLVVGMAVGGVGVAPGSYITALGANSVTLSLAPRLNFYAVATAGSNTLTGVSSLSGVAVGQLLTGSGSTWPFATGSVAVNSINAAANTITVGAAAINGSPIPDSFNVSGTWTTNLSAVVQAPVLLWHYNINALRNQYFYQIGAGMVDVWIAGSAGNTSGRLMPGVQGVQISGYDGFSSSNLRVDNLDGSGLILGGYVPGQTGSTNMISGIRESHFAYDQIRNSGDAKTGQAALMIMTPFEGALSTQDEINEIEFTAGRYVCSQGNAISVGTYNTSHGPAQGPRGLFFDAGVQIEGCAQSTFDTAAQSDSIFVQNATSIRFSDGDVSIPGTGKALLHLENTGTLTMVNMGFFNQGSPIQYTVGVTNGSTNVTYTSGGGTQNTFNAGQTWDGIGVKIGSTLIHLAGLSPVAANGLSLTLASPWTGGTGSQTMFVSYGGAFLMAPDTTLTRLDAKGLLVSGNLSETNTLLGVADNNSLFKVGNNFDGGIGTLTTYDDLSGTRYTQGPFSWKTGGVVDTTMNGLQIIYNANSTAETDFINQRANLGGGFCFYNNAPNTALGTPLSCITSTGFTFGAAVGITHNIVTGACTIVVTGGLITGSSGC